MEYAIINVPAAPVRLRPAHRKEMVNQLLFGETVRVLKEKGDLWVKIRSLHDNYEGWMTNTLLETMEEESACVRSVFVASGLINQVKQGEKTIHVPFGSTLPFFENGKGRIGLAEYSFNGLNFNRDQQHANAEKMGEWARGWLNAPYLWGGRTPLGVDCSGFMQVLFKMTGIDLPRDTWQQAQDGRGVKKFQDAMPGDLVFFDNKEEIVHVGMLLDKEHVIHASGKVRIDNIDKKGIINVETGKRTMSLKAIRRFLAY